MMRVYWERGPGEEVLKHAPKAAEAGWVDDPALLLVRADSYLFGGLADRALPIYGRVIELDPMNPDAHWGRVMAALYDEKFELSIQPRHR